ncbi:hypothetical protein D3C87_1176540 [compost metagenome]|jgi:Txe/YoeB family toxin of Txe-Axe toxin-antitoxin module|uniref:hypothetical protein n=1 Tax=Sphingobacterium faecium TaxID=34087 RepID=UPI000D391FBD|nr:hypothetical protein [Sphingobacterium faecium]MQP26752.1 hypothetical protein [Sphingobacterium faecium]PTX12521.1 hypothetical protein C8N37_102215 [Sphingobacterium faecium]GEM62230.1 hypothetical protein SF1_02120 [Sphingobacterium faecium NBRC 15299]
MELANITKARLVEAQNNGYTAIITKYNSNPLDPIWIFEKVKKDQLFQFSEKLNETFQLCYPISEAIETVEEYPFIGKVKLPD